MQYKIVEEKESPFETIIEQSGHTTNFTLQQVLDHQHSTEKTLRQTGMQLQVNDALDNVAIAVIPTLKELPIEKIEIIMAWAGRQAARPELIDLKETCEKTLVTYTEKLADIKEQTGITFTEIPTGVSTAGLVCPAGVEDPECESCEAKPEITATDEDIAKVIESSKASNE